MGTHYGTSGQDNIRGDQTSAGEADTIYGYGLSSPTATQVGTGMFQPVFATAPAGDTSRLFVAEKGVFGTALVKIIDLQNPAAAATTILTLTSGTDGNETGLLGLALHPEFAVEGSPHRGKLYVNYSGPAASGYDQLVVEYTFDPNNPAAGPIAPPKTIMTIDYTGPNHHAGWMDFGPDGMLYIATGEDQVASNSQTILNQDGSANLKGKILRIDVNGDSFPGDANNNYRIPTDNPTDFEKIGTVAQSAIWAVGLRNPWRCSFGPDGTLYIADVGEQSYEEINIGRAGANYGWRATTGGANGDGPQGNGYTDPAYYYQHNVMGRSITGGYVYKGPGDFNGHYIFGDYGNGQIFAIDFRDENPTAVNITNRIAFPNNTPVGGWQLVSFGQDGQGNLYVLGMNGRILRLDLSGSTTDLGDTLDGAGGNDTIYGGDGDDTIYGGADSDHLYGDNGNDRLYGGDATGLDTSADTLTGGAGSDIYYVDGSDMVIESSADDGQDEVHAAGSFTLGAGQAVEWLYAKDGDSDIDLTGNERAQTIIGNAGKNRLDGGGGADTLRGLGGDDTYVVNNTGVTISETDANGNDTGGNDTIVTRITYDLTDYLENLTLEGTAAINGTGNDLANIIIGNTAANVLDGGRGADRLEGGGGNDTYRIDNANDVIVEGAGGGIDTLIASASYTLGGTAHVEILRADGTAAINLTGNDFANTFHGNSANNRFDGRGGQDTVVLTGQRSDYEITLSGDILTIKDKRANGDGTDTITGAEIFQFSNGKKISFENILNNAPSGVRLEGDVIREHSKAGDPIGKLSVTDDANDRHQFTLVDNAGGRFSLDADGTLRVANGVLLDYEQAQKHTIEVTVTDVLGEKLTKRIDVTVQDWLAEQAVGSALADVIKGGYGNDVLSGLGGNDMLSAGIGNDRLIGGLGKDTLTGGTGRDVFVFDDRDTGTSKSRADYITDFSGRGGDKIDLKLVDADAKKRGDQKFAFIGKEAFTKAGQVRYEKTKKDTYVYLNTDNDKAAEAVIKLKGSFDLQKSWFVL